MTAIDPDGQYWIGGYQKPLNEPINDKGWKWITAEPFNYVNWGDGEPSGGIGENHLAMWSHGKWNDEGSAIASNNGYIAESPTVYDTFDEAPLDEVKWGDLELVREISGGELRLNVQGKGEQVTNRLHPVQKTDYFQAKVIIEGDTWADKGGSFSLEGMFYNMKRGPGSGKNYNGDKDEVWIANQIRLDEKGDLSATASVSRIRDPQGNTETVLFTQDFPTTINFDGAYNLSVEYDANNSRIIFKCNGDELTYNIDTPQYPSGTDYRAIESRIFAGGAGYMKTRVDDVYLQQGVVYDDFAGVLLDPARWEDLTVVRETDDGKLRLNVQTQDLRTDNTLPFRKHDLTNIEARVNISSDSWVSADTTAIVRVAGWYYNDSRDGMKRKYKGNKGDVWAHNRISLDENGELVAICALWRCDTSDPWGPGTTLFYQEFNTQINFDTPYLLGIKFKGGMFTFRCNNEYHQYKVTGNQFPPSELYRHIQSRVYADDGESGYIQVNIEEADASFRKMTLLYPDGGEVLKAGECTSIKWGATENAATFKLKFSSDKGKHWQTLANNLTDYSHDICIDPQDQNLKRCLFKVFGYKANGNTIGSDTSDKPFAIEVVKLTSPDGGEIFSSGGLHDLSWITYDTEYDVDFVKIFCSTNGGESWKLMDTVNGNPGSASCEFPKVKENKDNCLVKVQLSDLAGNETGTDVSNNPFMVEVLRLKSPNGGETLTAGETYTVEWDTFEPRKKIAKIVLKYTKNGGKTWKKIKKIKGNNPGSYLWTVPGFQESKTKCKVKVELYDKNGKSLGEDSSDSHFKIVP